MSENPYTRYAPEWPEEAQRRRRRRRLWQAAAATAVAGGIIAGTVSLAGAQTSAPQPAASPVWGWVWISWVVVLAAILVGCHALPGRRRWTFRGGAEAVLAERVARGDIDANEYQRRLATLREAPSPQNRGGYQ